MLEDPVEQAAEDWAVNAAVLEGEELPGPRPPRKRQKRANPPGELQVPCSFPYPFTPFRNCVCAAGGMYIAGGGLPISYIPNTSSGTPQGRGEHQGCCLAI